MRIYALDDLPRALRPQLAGFGVVDGDPPQDWEFLQRLRRRRPAGLPCTDYYAVYAVEEGQLLSRVETLDLAFTGAHGLQKVVGISDVLTRPDGLGRGFARALLREVHRRGREQGRRWSFLWTHRTWGAHALYARLGYRDVYSPPTALRRVRAAPHRALRAGYRWSTAGRGDVERLERLLSDGTRGRWGFVPRAAGALRLRLALGWRRAENHRILSFRSRAVGYAYLSEPTSWNVSTNEVLLISPEHTGAMVDALESLARGRWLTLQSTSFVRDAEALLRPRGYQFYPTSHTTLMAKRLGPARPADEDPGAVFRNPAVSSHRGDMF